MKKRHRKKHHIGEFTQLGFEVGFHIHDAIEEKKREDIIWAFIVEAIEPNHLCAGGGGSNPVSFFVVPEGHKTATNEHIESVREWLANESSIKSYSFGPLKDAWNDEAYDLGEEE